MKRKRDSMGEIELKFNFDTESRGAGYCPAAKFYIHDIYARALRSSARAQTGYIGGNPYAPFLRNSLGSAKELHNQYPR